MRTKLAIVAMTACFMGCGSSTDDGGGPGGPGYVPSNHTVDNNSQRVTVAQAIAIGPFALPSGATVTYQITDTPSGVGSDTMNVVVAADSMRTSGGTIVGYGAQNGVASTTITTVPVPAGAYDLFVFCNNFVDDCFFTDVVTAYY